VYVGNGGSALCSRGLRAIRRSFHGGATTSNKCLLLPPLCAANPANLGYTHTKPDLVDFQEWCTALHGRGLADRITRVISTIRRAHLALPCPQFGIATYAQRLDKPSLPSRPTFDIPSPGHASCAAYTPAEISADHHRDAESLAYGDRHRQRHTKSRDECLQRKRKHVKVLTQAIFLPR